MSALALALCLLSPLISAAPAYPVVDTAYPYLGPAVPIADIADQTIEGNGKGFIRLYEPPAVAVPFGSNATNNINVISLAYVPTGMAVHFQTPFGIDGDPCVEWGTELNALSNLTKGYDRTPPCSSFADLTQCSQFFHDVLITGLSPATKYYYRVPGGNGTTPSDVLSFTTAVPAGEETEFSVAVLHDMGYTNAVGTYLQLNLAVESGASFVWHGGDISYADDVFRGVRICDDPYNASTPLTDLLVCWNSSTTGPSESTLPNGVDDPEYYEPVPEGELHGNQGSPRGGDVSPIYENNWDIWQNWMNPITKRVPYMVATGNHDVSCAENEGSDNEITAYLVDGKPIGSGAPKSNESYYTCPPSQRNFTAYSHRFRMPGEESKGRSNFWYSFDQGPVHFVTFNSETDYAASPNHPFGVDLKGNETHPLMNQTMITDSGPFGHIGGNGSLAYTPNYEQYQWLKDDLESVDRTKTPWVFALAHRPMYSSRYGMAYQINMRDAWEKLLIDNGVDAFFAGHIHYYERFYPIIPDGTNNGTIDQSSVIDDHNYVVNPGKSLVHITNGQAGNVESHTTLGEFVPLPATAYVNDTKYGFSKLTVHNGCAVTWEFVHGGDGQVLDWFRMMKPSGTGSG